ncbi:integrase [Thermoanaerobacteraceae bacterium SP2]|nr:integrase [Thermoanaerobacteraceae bacterium SP2]
MLDYRSFLNSKYTSNVRTNILFTLREFLKYSSEIGQAPHVSSYSDAFILFFRYCDEVAHIRQDKLTFKKINKHLVEGFCEWLEAENGCSVSTRNQRLAALHALFRYIQTESPEHISLCRDILSIRMKKTQKIPPKFLPIEAIKMLLATPDMHSKEGRRDLAVLTLLYDTAARVQELIDLCVGDVSLAVHSTVKLTGKGNKVRLVPILPETANIIRLCMKENQLNKPQCAELPLLTNKSHCKLTRVGITYILNKYVSKARKTAPELFPEPISPHILRHSKATHLLMGDVNLIYIRDLLGHVSVVTTEIYAKTNPEFMRKAIEKVAANTSPKNNYTEEEKQELIDFLKRYRI